MKLLRGILSITLALGVFYGTWLTYKVLGFDMAAIVFGVTGATRALVLAWLRRNEQPSVIFRSRMSGVIQSPMQEFAFMAPIYLAPAIWNQFGLLIIFIVPTLWIALRGVVAMVVRKTAGV